LNGNLDREEQHLVASLSSSTLADRQVTISEGDSTEQITRTLDRASPDLIGRITEAIGRVWTNYQENL
jgi:hypothetical protein